jgi:hypothetical protein
MEIHVSFSLCGFQSVLEKPIHYQKRPADPAMGPTDDGDWREEREEGGSAGELVTMKQPLVELRSTTYLLGLFGDRAISEDLLRDPWLCGPASRRVCLDPSRESVSARAGPMSGRRGCFHEGAGEKWLPELFARHL